MITKLQSLPNYFRSEASPKVQDSAFPPFKIEHRYRGVYERAGFDVNLPGINGDTRNNSTSIGAGSAGYLTPPKSVSPPASTTSSTSEKKALNGSKRLDALRKAEAKSAVELRKQKFNPYDNIHKMPSSASSLPVFPEHKDKSIPYSSAPYTSGGRTPYESDGNILLKQNTFATEKNDENIRSVKHSDHQKNHKNLRLNLGVFPDTSNNVGLDLPMGNTSISPQEKLQISMSNSRQSPLKSASSAENTTPYPNFDAVSPPLDISNEDSRIYELDEEQQFNFNTPFQKQEKFSLNDVGEVQNITSNNQREELDESPKIPPRNEQRMVYDSPANLTILVSRFDSFIKSSEINSRGSLESEMLNPIGNNDHGQFLKNLQRVSNLSMVSSIISKTSDYDEDDEIEKELERQLESLKVGESATDIGVQNDSKDIEHNLKIEKSSIPPLPTIPTINIEDIDNSIPLEYNTPNSSFHLVNTSYDQTDNHHSSNDNDETRSTFSFETIEPLTIRQNDSYSTDNTTSYGASDDAYNSNSRYYRNLTFSENNHLTDSTIHTRTLISDDDDLVKPLSPKTHQVEKELRDIGMRDLNEGSNPLSNQLGRGYPLQDITYQDVLPSNDTFGDEINKHILSLHANTSLKDPHNSNSLETFKYPPGEGPCRSCKLEIDSNGKGLQRAIHSKTGELSGQWHRGCFHCSFDGCKIFFNKNVHCYVLSDQPLCRQHYHEQNNTICESCNLGIEGECVVNELEQKWHLNCLLCHSCQNSINSDYYLINGSVFCERDAEEIINGRQTYGDNNGLTSRDKIEKRRTRLLFVE